MNLSIFVDFNIGYHIHTYTNTQKTHTHARIQRERQRIALGVCVMSIYPQCAFMLALLQHYISK
jgi:hypothetical protein